MSGDLSYWRHNDDTSGLQFTEVISRTQNPDSTEVVQLRFIGDSERAFARIVGELVTD